MNDHLIERIYDMHDKVVGKLVRKGIDRNEAPDLAVNILLDGDADVFLDSLCS